MNEEPCRLESGADGLCGMLYDPAGAAIGAVLICNPLFEERKSAQRALVETARTLAEAGLGVLRFDYRGCGDSGGAFSDFSVSDWLADIRTAVAFLKSRFLGVPLGVLGLRLGASLALAAADSAEAPTFDFAVLWEPVGNGREDLDQELRRKLMKEMMTYGRSRVTREELSRELAAGRTVDFDGHPVTPALYRDLAELRLDRPLHRAPARCLAVGIGPTGRVPPYFSRIQETLQNTGAACEVRALRHPPFWNLVGLVSCAGLIADTRSWIRQTIGSTS